MSSQPGHHEGRRVLPGGVSPASFVIMTGVGVFFAILPVVVKAPWWQGILAVLLVVGLFTVVTARETQRTVTITPTEVRERGLVGTRVIPRSAIAEVVVVRELQLSGVGGLVGLLGDDGRCLRRWQTSLWPPETIDALVMAGRSHNVVVGQSVEDVRRRWPRLLRWQWVHRPLAITLAVVVGVAVMAAVLVVITRLTT
ncbi:hypothetical protein [Janibacter hoylei]|uniref:hypothetical protein n=1 Tax=Janibacter hoylei TaxID=364298 RepID=UPI0027BAB69F|nr:hypothetical protein [Janibacter hoylei]